MARNIFDRRVAFKPFDYPDILQYKDAINHSYWLVSEWNFLGDVHDFRVTLDDRQRSAVRNALLAISQVEVSVKRFWTRLGDRFPRAEFEQVGVTFGESEVRHADAYSHLLEVLGLNADFETVLEVPAIRGRVEYLTRALAGSGSASGPEYVRTLALFSILVENVSLFGQFLVIKSFNKHLGVLKDVDNVVQATQKEETIHAMLGVAIINLVRAENPAWFDGDFYEDLAADCRAAFEAESAIVDWIFEAGELEFLRAAEVKEFLRHRFNQGLALIGGGPAFAVDQSLLAGLSWFSEESLADVNTDFFHKKPVTYSKKTQPITAGDLF